MKRSKIVSLFAVSLVLTLGAVGCKKKPVGVTPIPTGLTGPRGGETKGMNDLPENFRPIPDSQTSIEGIPLAAGQNWDGRPKDKSALQAETVYFALDSSTIRDAEHAKLDKVADYLKSNPSNDLIIEGHADERGTEGYNLALAEKRALALREYLIASKGISPERIQTVSYGETRPAEEGHNEAAWSKNRRGEFVVVLPAAQ